MNRLLPCVAWIVAAAVAVAVHVDDSRRRKPAEEFVREYGLETRRPTHTSAIANAPSSDFALQAAADAALQDSVGMVNLSQMPPETRQLWIASVGHFDDELRDGSSFLLDALALRPGWPNHRGLLGEVEFMLARRQMRLADDPQRWLAPLRSALAASPGKEGFAVFAAGASMEAWPYLGMETRNELEPFFTTAMSDSRFVRVTYRDLLTLVGRETLLRWLPQVPASIRAAMDVEAALSNVREVADLHRRWERAEWQARISDLEAIEDRARARDEIGLRRACATWLRTHGVADFDHETGRRQVSRVLALWPAEPGEWRRDPRATAVQFFLNGRLEYADGPALYRAVSNLSGTPDVVMARAALRAGQDYEAARIAESSETKGAFEWTRYYVELAQHHFERKNVDAAREALEKISPAARDECDVTLMRRLTENDSSPAFSGPDGAYWSGLNLPLCLQPGAKELEIRVSSPSDALVSFGLDGGRLATRTIPAGLTSFNIAVTQQGRHIFSFRAVAGATIEPVDAIVR